MFHCKNLVIACGQLRNLLSTIVGIFPTFVNVRKHSLLYLNIFLQLRLRSNKPICYSVQLDYELNALFFLGGGGGCKSCFTEFVYLMLCWSCIPSFNFLLCLEMVEKWKIGRSDRSNMCVSLLQFSAQLKAEQLRCLTEGVEQVFCGPTIINIHIWYKP